MEKKISIFFSKLSPIQGKENYLIELSINNKTNIIQYPQASPLIIPFPLIKEKQIISINVILKQIPNKQRIIAHGEIILNKKFLNQKPIEKYVLLFKENKRKNKEKVNVKLNNSDCFGKIFAEIKLDDHAFNDNKVNEKENSKDKNINIDINDEQEKEKNKIKNDSTLEKDELNKNILELGENKDINLYNNIDDFLSYENINKLKEKLEKGKNLFPKDINYLKSFNKNLFNQSKLFNEKFSNILTSLIEENQNIEKKVKDITVKNNEIEEEINKFQLQLNKKDEEIKQKTQEIEDKNNLSLKNSESIKDKKTLINESLIDTNDMKDICDLIKKFFALGYNIQEGDLTENDKKNLIELLNNNYDKEKKEKIKNEESYDEKELNSLKDDLDLAEEIITLIERDVNYLFSKKLIELVTIDQIDSTSYIFSGKEKKKEISFKIEDNNLICSTGENFKAWLKKNFRI